MGFSAIPVLGKEACVKGWQKWCMELPPRYIVEQWEKNYPLPKYGVGICCGPASGLDALDIDSDSKDILGLCPRSPISRKGARGSMPLFLHNPKLIKVKADRDNLTPNEIYKRTEGIQVLSIGNYFVAPPSIHPDTGRPYLWESEYCLENFSITDLEQLDNQMLEPAIVLISRFKLTRADGTLASSGGGGRNEKLASMCYAKIVNHPEKLDSVIAEELLEFDEAKHSPPYFSDKNEMYFRKAPTPFGRAMLFVSGSRARILRKGII
jgi:hypothetical protein